MTPEDEKVLSEHPAPTPVEIGTPVWLYACGKYRLGTVAKIGRTRIYLKWTAPSSGISRVKPKRLADQDREYGWGIGATITTFKKEA